MNIEQKIEYSTKFFDFQPTSGHFNKKTILVDFFAKKKKEFLTKNSCIFLFGFFWKGRIFFRTFSRNENYNGMRNLSYRIRNNWSICPGVSNNAWSKRKKASPLDTQRKNQIYNNGHRHISMSVFYYFPHGIKIVVFVVTSINFHISAIRCVSIPVRSSVIDEGRFH